MVQAYNFLASWQLFPEKSEFEYQIVPKSGNYKIESVQNGHALSFSHNWVNIENEAFYAQYSVIPNGIAQEFENPILGNEVLAEINNGSCLHLVLIMRISIKPATRSNRTPTVNNRHSKIYFSLS